jgi:hypothetical protein
MKRYWSLLAAVVFVLGLVNVIQAQAAAAENRDGAEIAGALAPQDITPEPPPSPPAGPLFAPFLVFTNPPLCAGVEVPDITLSPLRANPIEVQVFTENAAWVSVGDLEADVDDNGIATFNFDAVPDEVYAVEVNGGPAPDCAFSFDETPSRWIGQHGDPYAWVGEQSWVEQEGIYYLFTTPTVDVDLSPDLLIETENETGRWTYFVQYVGSGMTLYSGMLRPGEEDFQHVYRVALMTPDDEVLRISNLGHVISPEETGPLTVDSGPETEAIEWEDGEAHELDAFDIEFAQSHTHNGIHQAVLVTVPGDNSQWIFSREINGEGGSLLSARIDGRIIADSTADVGGVFGQLLRGETPTPNDFVVGVVEDDMPGTPEAAAASVHEPLILDSEQWAIIVELFGEDW